MNRQHQIESELLGTTPRKIAATISGQSMGIGCLRLFILPFILIGIGVVVMFLAKAVIIVAGVTVPGKVVDKKVTTDSDGNSYKVFYTYLTDDQSQHHSKTVPQDVYNTIEVGMNVPVKHLPFLPNLISTPQFTSDNPWRELGFYMLFGLLWNSIVSVFAYIAYILPWQIANLYKYGDVGLAKITDKTLASDSDGDATYYIHYTYESPTKYGFIGDVFKKKHNLPKEDWEKLQVGNEITILFHPRKPKNSVPYAYGGYKVIG